MSVYRWIVPFGPIDPRLKMTIRGRQYPVSFLEHEDIIHNRLADLDAMLELRLDHAVKLLKSRC